VWLAAIQATAVSATKLYVCEAPLLFNLQTCVAVLRRFSYIFPKYDSQFTTHFDLFTHHASIYHAAPQICFIVKTAPLSTTTSSQLGLQGASAMYPHILDDEEPRRLEAEPYRHRWDECFLSIVDMAADSPLRAYCSPTVLRLHAFLIVLRLYP
jgi:hypothetical protein